MARRTVKLYDALGATAISSQIESGKIRAIYEIFTIGPRLGPCQPNSRHRRL